MRDHEAMLAAYAAQLARRGLGEHQIAELLDHLHCSIEQRIDAGDAPAVATHAAIAAVGDVATVTREYKKEGLVHPLQKLVGVVFVLCAVATAVVLQGGDVAFFVSAAAVVPLLTIGAVTMGGLAAAFGMRRVCHLIAALWSGRDVSMAEAAVLQQMCLRGQRLARAGCVIDVACTSIHVLSVLDSPQMIGPWLCSLLLAVVYAALIADLGFGSAERWVTQQAA